MTTNLEFRTFQKGDEEGLSQLMREILKVDRDTKYWQWKYHQNPAGKHFMVVALDKDKIVGAYGFIPFKMKVGSKVLLVAQGLDIAIFPSYRGKRTIFKLEKKSTELSILNNVVINYGFTNKVMHRLVTRYYTVCYGRVYPIYNMAKVINPTPYLQQRLHLPCLTPILGFAGRQLIKMTNKKKLLLPNGCKISEVTHFDYRFDEFWQKESKNYEIIIVRDSQYLNWRYIQNPISYKIYCIEQDESIKGFIVLKCSQEEVKRGRIVDIFVESGEERIINLFITAAINYFLEEKIDIITTWMMEHRSIFQVLKKKGFIKRKTTQDFVVRSLTPDISNEYLKEKCRWYITMGDSDYY